MPQGNYFPLEITQIMKLAAILPSLLLCTCFTALMTERSSAALVITLSPNGSGGTIFQVSGSGTTGAGNISQFTSLAEEQWVNMTGDPFKDAYDNADFFLVTPIQIQPGVFITGIEVDSDPGASAVDDFRLYLSASMAPDAAYSANGMSAFTVSLAHADLNVGTYTDNDDGGTTFLNGFTLVIDNNTVIPEPTGALLTVFAAGILSFRRKRP